MRFIPPRQTRVFVTNAVTYLPKMDRIVVLKDGSISEVGSFDQLMANNGAFAEFLSQHISQQMESGVELDEDGELLNHFFFA